MLFDFLLSGMFHRGAGADAKGEHVPEDEGSLGVVVIASGGSHQRCATTARRRPDVLFACDSSREAHGSVLSLTPAFCRRVAPGESPSCRPIQVKPMEQGTLAIAGGAILGAAGPAGRGRLWMLVALGDKKLTEMVAPSHGVVASAAGRHDRGSVPPDSCFVFLLRSGGSGHFVES